MLTFTALIMLGQTIACIIVAATNAPAIAACKLQIWLFVQGGTTLLIFLGSIYIHKKINAGDGGSFTRAKTACNVFLYDPGACVFLVLLVFGFAWFITGFVFNNNDCAGSGPLQTMTTVAQILMILWPFVLLSVYVSLMCKAFAI
jgi:hypothetical protein